MRQSPRRIFNVLSPGVLLVFMAGAVFAAETPNYLPPKSDDYKVDGAINPVVTNIVSRLSKEQDKALQAVYGALDGSVARDITVAQVEFMLPESGAVTIHWLKDELLYNYKEKKFVSYEAASSKVRSAAANPAIDLKSDGGKYTFTKLSPFSNPDVTEPAKAGYVSVRGAVDSGGGGGGGCSALTLGAVALFLLPAFGLNRLRKK